MALYLGNQKVKFNLNGFTYKLNILIPNDSLATTVKLLLSDGRILKESNGLFLVYKEDE